MDSRSQDSTMGETSITNKRSTATIFLAHLGGFLFLILAASWLRRITLHPDPLLQGYLQVISGLLAFVFAAVTLVRFQGTQDRISLILGAGFLLSGAILTATSVLFFQFLPDAPLRLLWAPAAWWVGRMVLALLFLVALLVERFLPRSRHPRGEIAGALLAVIALTYVFAAALRHLPPEVSPHPSAFFPGPQQLLPAAILLISLIWYRRRLSIDDSAFDRTLYAAAWLNVAAQLSAAQSVRLLDVLENETDRTDRTGRPFSVLLLDLDGLKNINDGYGHLVGSRAICRLADILRIHCRAIDTAARYGGDEFALVLPESEEADARRVADRIREVLAGDDEPPRLSASIGISIYRGDGERIEKLLSEADQDLYAEKAKREKRLHAVLHPRRRIPKA